MILLVSVVINTVSRMAWSCRAPLVLTAIFCGVMGATLQAPESIVIVAEQIEAIYEPNGSHRARYFHNVLGVLVFTILLWYYCFSLSMSEMRRRNTVSFNRRHVAALLATVVSATPVVIIYYALSEAADRIGGSTGATFIAETTPWVQVAFATVWLLYGFGLLMHIFEDPIDGTDHAVHLFQVIRWINFFVLPIIVLISAAIFLTQPYGFFTGAGVFQVLVISCVCYTIVLSAASKWAADYGFPLTSVTIGLVCASLLLNEGRSEHESTDKTPSKEVMNQSPAETLSPVRDWFKERAMLARAMKQSELPVYIFAAQGGGAYAAYHSATLLTQLSRRDPQFAKNLFAISAVSGGSIGAYVFRELLASRRIEWDENVFHLSGPEYGVHRYCSENESIWFDAQQQIDKLFKTDFLAPVVKQLFLTDLPRFFGITGAAEYISDRVGRKLVVQHRNDALREAIGGAIMSAIHRDLEPMRSTDTAHPAIFFNAVVENSANRIYIAPFHVETDNLMTSASARSDRKLFQKFFSDVKITSLEAALISARFPWIVPPSRVKIDGKKHVVVDGGYFDNSGLATALDVKRFLDEQIMSMSDILKDLTVKIVIISTALDESSQSNGTLSDGFAEVIMPLVIFTRSWSTRGREQAYEVSALAKRDGFTVYDAYVGRKRRMPLGWAISWRTMMAIKGDVDADLARFKMFNCYSSQ